MPAPEVRPFRRTDRDQLTGLVNLHVAAVVPGVPVSVNTVLGDLERRPGEFVTDPWVAERTTLVAEQRGHVLAAAHLLRHRADAEVGATYRDAAEINWFVHRPEASLRPDADLAADLLMRACLDGSPAGTPGSGTPTDPCPPRSSTACPATGRTSGPSTNARGSGTPGTPRSSCSPGCPTCRPPGPGRGSRPSARRGSAGPRFTARAEGRTLGHIEIDTALARPERHARAAGLADVGNLHIDPAQHGTGPEHWLLARAADWLRLCGVDRLAAYESAADSAALALLAGAGFRELTRTDRGWEHRPERAQIPGR
ncbi:hypothetical protein GCM10010228_30470 [Streptomyces massasporeus]|nr:hypothetical protein GCM10010228_30470 [Streptomyces massasporeus]